MTAHDSATGKPRRFADSNRLCVILGDLTRYWPGPRGHKPWLLDFLSIFGIALEPVPLRIDSPSRSSHNR